MISPSTTVIRTSNRLKSLRNLLTQNFKKIADAQKFNSNNINESLSDKKISHNLKTNKIVALLTVTIYLMQFKGNKNKLMNTN